MRKMTFLCITLAALTIMASAGTTDIDYATQKAAMGGNNPFDVVVSSLCNSVVCVQIDEDGDFNIGTSTGENLLYYYPQDPWSTDIRIWIDGRASIT